MNKKEKHNLANKKWYIKHSNYYSKNKIKRRLVTSKYRNTEKGYLKSKQATQNWNKSKQGKQFWIERKAKRKRELGWILLCENPFADSVLVDYHHIFGAYVVAVPRDLHRLYCGKYHRENLRPILEQIYLGD